MNELLCATVLISTSFFDALRDKWNRATNKRPFSKWPWPLIDKWHAVKKAQLYSISVYIIVLWQFPALRPDPVSWWWIGGIAILAQIVWRLPDKPFHWK